VINCTNLLDKLHPTSYVKTMNTNTHPRAKEGRRETMTVEFNATLFRTHKDRAEAIAQEFLSAGGLNSRDEIRTILADNSDGELADETMREWFSPADPDAPDTGNEPVRRADLISGFAAARATFPEWLLTD